MTERTKKLILDFYKKGDVNVLPSIFIGIHEEDNISNEIPFKNCLRVLRNISAHDPVVITGQLLEERNLNSSKVTFIQKSGIDSMDFITLDLAQFFTWMVAASKVTGCIEYLVLAKALVQIACPCIKRGSHTFTTVRARGETVLDVYKKMVVHITKVLSLPRPVSFDDAYLKRLYIENQRLFWKICVPDMMNIVSVYVNDINLANTWEIDFYLELARGRE